MQLYDKDNTIQSLPKSFEFSPRVTDNVRTFALVLVSRAS